MEEYTTRSASPDDLEFLLAFEQGIIEAERPFDPTLRKGTIHYYDLAKLINSNEAEIVVIVHGTEIVASGSATIKEAKPYLDHDAYGYLGFMYTHPDHRGKGLNKLVVDALLAWCEAKGLPEVRLDVYSDNPGAIRAYEKVGFAKHLIEMRLRGK